MQSWFFAFLLWSPHLVKRVSSNCNSPFPLTHQPVISRAVWLNYPLHSPAQYYRSYYRFTCPFITVNICLHPATADCGPAPLEDKYPYQTKEETQPATTSLSRAWSWCVCTFCYQPNLKLWPWVCIESEGSMNTQRWCSQATGIEMWNVLTVTCSSLSSDCSTGWLWTHKHFIEV